MSIRVAFNGGELSPQVQMRADLDVFARGCKCVENFDIDQAGGVSRRRGFRTVTPAQGENSRLFTYRYANDESYLVEVGELRIRVWSPGGTMEWSAASPYGVNELTELRTVQLNSLLIFVCGAVPLHQLRCDSAGVWELREYAYKFPAWRWSSPREFPVLLRAVNGRRFSVELPADEAAAEREYSDGDLLRVSYYTTAREIRKTAVELMGAVGGTFAEGFINAQTLVERGTVIAVRRTPQRVAYTALVGWAGAERFVTGLLDPKNYPSDFAQATEVAGITRTLTSLDKSVSLTKGESFWFDAGYWDIFTCVKDFSGAERYVEGASNPEDYPGHFVRGVMVGSAPCKGRWKLHLSGTWYGSYEVRACYDGEGTQYDEWESRAEAWSPNAAPVNEPVAGDEGGSECWVSLWLTRVRAYGGTLTTKCFPADACGNVLVVASYKHDLQLRAHRKEAGTLPSRAATVLLEQTCLVPDRSVQAWVEWRGETGIGYMVTWTGDMSRFVEAVNATMSSWTAELVDAVTARLSCRVVGAAGNALWVGVTGRNVDMLRCVFEPGADEQVVEAEDYFEREDRVQPAVAGDLSSLDWSWCAWGARYGYPRLASVFNQRLVLAGTDAQPLTLWMSQTDDLDNFEITDEDTSGMALTVSAETQDPIRWMVSQAGRLLLGTSEGEYVAQSGGAGVMTNANAVITAHGFVGSSRVPAIRGSDRVIYFERGGGRVMQYGYDQSQDAYISTDLTVYAAHVLEQGGGVKEGCFLRKPDVKAVMVLANGQLALMTYNAAHRVNAWHRYVTDGRFLSVAMLPNGERPDSLYAVVKRGDAYWIECLDERSDFVDGGGAEYVSTLLTNALSVVRLGAPKVVDAELWLYLHEECKVQGVELTVDGGGRWRRVPRQIGDVMSRGWHRLGAVPNVGMERCVGFRCSGNQGMVVGAIQA